MTLTLEVPSIAEHLPSMEQPFTAAEANFVYTPAAEELHDYVNTGDMHPTDSKWLDTVIASQAITEVAYDPAFAPIDRWNKMSLAEQLFRSENGKRIGSDGQPLITPIRSLHDLRSTEDAWGPTTTAFIPVRRDPRLTEMFGAEPRKAYGQARRWDTLTETERQTMYDAYVSTEAQAQSIARENKLIEPVATQSLDNPQKGKLRRNSHSKAPVTSVSATPLFRQGKPSDVEYNRRTPERGSHRPAESETSEFIPNFNVAGLKHEAKHGNDSRWLPLRMLGKLAANHSKDVSERIPRRRRRLTIAAIGLVASGSIVAASHRDHDGSMAEIQSRAGVTQKDAVSDQMASGFYNDAQQAGHIQIGAPDKHAEAKKPNAQSKKPKHALPEERAQSAVVTDTLSSYWLIEKYKHPDADDTEILNYVNKALAKDHTTAYQAQHHLKSGDTVTVA